MTICCSGAKEKLQTPTIIASRLRSHWKKATKNSTFYLQIYIPKRLFKSKTNEPMSTTYRKNLKASVKHKRNEFRSTANDTSDCVRKNVCLGCHKRNNQNEEKDEIEYNDIQSVSNIISFDPDVTRASTKCTRRIRINEQPVFLERNRPGKRRLFIQWCDDEKSTSIYQKADRLGWLARSFAEGNDEKKLTGVGAWRFTYVNKKFVGARKSNVRRWTSTPSLRSVD